jgi:ERO1-like protein alpha
MQELIDQIVSSPVLASTCDLPFDLGRMWKGEQGPQLRLELQGHFQNITSIMDCVGCEKCKLWGKLQFLGVATALKILFASDDCFAEGVPPKQLLESLKLERNEVIALVNLLTKLSHSVSTYRSLSQKLYVEEGIQACIGVEDLLA